MTPRVLILRAALALAALLGLAAAGCSSGPESPEALFREFVARHVEGDFSGTWTLLSAEGRKRWSDGIDRNRETLRRNPRNPGISRQYYVTEEEFKTLPHDELWKRTQRPDQRTLLGAKIVKSAPWPGEPGVIALDVETATGNRFRWFVHEDGDRGWRLRDASPLVLRPVGDGAE